MRKIRLLIASLSVFAMLTACGQSFKAVKISSSGDIDQLVEQEKKDVPTGETSLTTDQQILQSYMSQLRGLQTSMIDNLAISIKSFEVLVAYTSHPGGASDVLYTVNATLKTSCSSSLSFRNQNLTFTQLKSGQRQSLGTNGLYEVLLQCTDNSCKEMVAAVRRQGDDSTDAMVLLGLKRKETFTSGGYTIEKFTSRYVDIDPYFTTALDIDFHTSICAQASQQSNVNVNSTFGSGSTSGTVVNPTSGGFAYDDLDAFGGAGPDYSSTSSTNTYQFSNGAF